MFCALAGGRVAAQMSNQQRRSMKSAAFVLRKLGRRLMLAAVLTIGVLGLTAGPAAAATTLDEGKGAFTATSAVNLTVPPPCAFYGNYEAELQFDSATVGNYTGPVTFQTNSTPGEYWGENNFGTFLPVVTSPPGLPTDTECRYEDPVTGAPPSTDAIPGFSGTLVGTNGSQTLNCTFSNGSYQRNGTRGDETGMDITFQGSLSGSPDCTAGSPLTVKTSLMLADGTPRGRACNSPIAPQTCVLDHARF
jgi:hypothetical protein